MGYKSRKFLSKDSIKLVAWQSEFIKSRNSEVFGDMDSFTWHELQISDGHSTVTLDEKEAASLLRELIPFLACVSSQEEKLLLKPKKPAVIKPNKKVKK